MDENVQLLKPMKTTEEYYDFVSKLDDPSFKVAIVSLNCYFFKLVKPFFFKVKELMTVCEKKLIPSVRRLIGCLLSNGLQKKFNRLGRKDPRRRNDPDYEPKISFAEHLEPLIKCLFCL